MASLFGLLDAFYSIRARGDADRESREREEPGRRLQDFQSRINYRDDERDDAHSRALVTPTIPKELMLHTLPVGNNLSTTRASAHPPITTPGRTRA